MVPPWYVMMNQRQHHGGGPSCLMVPVENDENLMVLHLLVLHENLTMLHDIYGAA